MSTYKDRLYDEKVELDKKIKKLEAFLQTAEREKLDIDDQALLFAQCKIMNIYSELLEERLF